MTLLEQRPDLKKPIRRIELEPPKEPPAEQRPVRWIAWSFSILVLAAAAITALVMTRGGEEAFADLYEAESPLAYGAVHEPGFTVAPRWVGESGPTLEEFEMIQGYRASVGEADLVFDRWVTESIATADRLAALEASTGEADRILVQSVGPATPRWFTAEELDELQASTGEADRRLVDLAG